MKKEKHSHKAFKLALCCLLHEKSLEKISVKEICLAADYSHMAFYANYQDKYDLAQQILDEEVNKRLEDCDVLATQILTKKYSFKTAIYEDARVFFEHVYNNRTIYECLFDNLLMPDATTQFASLVASQLLTKYHYEDDTKPQNYQQYFCQLQVMNLLSIGAYWSHHHYDLSPLSLAKIFSDYSTGWMAHLSDHDQKIHFSIQES